MISWFNSWAQGIILAVIIVTILEMIVPEGKNKKYIIGRMGMPYEDRGISIINVTLDAPEYVIQTLVSQLNFLQGVSVKAIYSQVEFKK